MQWFIHLKLLCNRLVFFFVSISILIWPKVIGKTLVHKYGGEKKWDNSKAGFNQ